MKQSATSSKFLDHKRLGHMNIRRGWRHDLDKLASRKFDVSALIQPRLTNYSKVWAISCVVWLGCCVATSFAQNIAQTEFENVSDPDPPFAIEFPNYRLSVEIIRQGNRQKILDFIHLVPTYEPAGLSGFLLFEFIANEDVQSELDLDAEQQKEVADCFEKYNRFLEKNGFKLVVGADGLRGLAKLKREKFLLEMQHGNRAKEILSESQCRRAVQLFRRYLMSCEANVENIFNDEICRIIEISDEQREDFLRIIDRSLVEWNQKNKPEVIWWKILEGSKENNPKNRDRLKTICSEYAKSTNVSPALLVAQLKLPEKFEEQNESDKVGNAIRQMIGRGSVIMPDASIVSPSMLPGANYGLPPQTVREAVQRIDTSKNELAWLEIVEPQYQQIADLFFTEIKNGSPRKRLAAELPMQEIVAKLSNCQDEVVYDQLLEGLKRSMVDSENQLVRELNAILLPTQTEAIAMAVALQNLPVLGPVRSCCVSPLKQEFNFSNEDIANAKKRSNQTFKKLVRELNEIENEITKILDPEQRKMYDDLFGKPTQMLPSFWWSLAVSRDLSKKGAARFTSEDVNLRLRN